MEKLVPKDHGEAVAVFRSQVIAPLLLQALTRGELRAALVSLSKQRYRPPGSDSTRTFSIPTLERWYYRFRKGQLAALVPRPRKDKGYAQGLTPELRELILGLRRENPSASAGLILSELVSQGQLTAGAVSASTLRRLMQKAGLDRTRLRTAHGSTRLRWEAAYAGELWHGDVCHGPTIGGEEHRLRPKIHALLDDKSRYIVALSARATEREEDMLGLLVGAVRRVGRPGALYLDNGSTYSGAALATACARLGTTLLHAKPYDPQARGKMERFWRTLRQKCLDHLSPEISLEQLQERLDTFLVRHYQHEPHEGLMGNRPANVWAEHRAQLVSEAELAAAMMIEKTRTVSKDGVVSIDGDLFEVRQGFLAGHRVKTFSCLVEGLPEVAEVEHDGHRYPLRPLDRTQNASARRPAAAPPVAGPKTHPFDPTASRSEPSSP